MGVEFFQKPIVKYHCIFYNIKFFYNIKKESKIVSMVIYSFLDISKIEACYLLGNQYTLVQ